MMLFLLPQRVALIVTTNSPPPNEARAIRRGWRRAISAQASRVVHVSFGRVVFSDCDFERTRPAASMRPP